MQMYLRLFVRGLETSVLFAQTFYLTYASSLPALALLSCTFVSLHLSRHRNQALFHEENPLKQDIRWEISQNSM